METIIFGGGFNPPTRAHETIIRACLDRPETEEVWVMPSGERHDKHFGLDDTDRMWMLTLMREEVFDSDERLRLSRFELDYMERPTQTHRTVDALESCYPDKQYRYVFGADAYRDMPNWDKGEHLQRSLGMLIVPRSDVVIVPAPNVEMLHITAHNLLSSTEVRVRVVEGGSIEDLVCRGVQSYIDDCRLYLNETV